MTSLFESGLIDFDNNIAFINLDTLEEFLNLDSKKRNLEIYLKKRFPTLSTNQIKSALDEIFDSIVHAVAKGERVEIRNFGVFSAKKISPRKFVNPKTKEVSYLSETTTLHFKPSKNLMSKI